MSIKIITDSAADLPEDIIKEYDIDVLPLLVSADKEVYKDGETITPRELFNNMREGKVYKTSQVPVGDFLARFKKYAENKTGCLYIAFSSELSGTYQSAVIAREQVREEYPDFDLDIIDTRCASLGEGLVVYKAAVMAREGKDKEEILKQVKFNAGHMEHIFTVDNLEYLYRGGRVSRTTAFVGGLLNIKPVLNVEDGRLVPIDKKRGRKRVFERMLELMEERGVDLADQTIGISHGDDIEGAESLKEMIRKRFGPDSFVINTIGAVIGAHAGPGTLAIFFLNDRRDNLA
ncbi:MAG: fatty acid kinase fatty acid binding subunit [Halanaerobiales bacterium]|nr:fatty acid kinase fatty acid binding subunit [Halanaerobiales bacterium]